jgi:hypothetical protein
LEQLTFRPTFPDWQKAARSALQRNVSPNDLVWEELLGNEPALDIFEEPEILPARNASHSDAGGEAAAPVHNVEPLHPQSPVKRTILDGLAHMLRIDLLFVSQIGDGP